MDGRIDQNGILYIERRGKSTRQICPFTHEAFCSHHCPLFGEPETDFSYEGPNEVEIRLQLCHHTVLYFQKFSDDREKPKELKK
jgi:hypothetical protein